jgi:hypothetical protein
MRLLVNATSYGAVPGGAGLRARYIFGSLRGHEIVFLVAEDTSPEVVPPGVETRVLPVCAADPLRRWLRLRLPTDGDVMFSDHYPATEIPTVLTLHDCGGALWRRRLIRRQFPSAHVVAVSETVRAAWDVDATVIPNGVDIGGLAPGALVPIYSLLVCDPGLPHKDAATARAVADRLDMPLREVGRGVEWLPHADLRAEIAAARVVLCPAREEGFGMVPLDALAAGRPVVVSDIPAHREVCGDAALYAPVGDVDAWCDAVRTALADADKWSERGLIRARAWSWSAAAERLSRLAAAAADQREAQIG